MTEPTVADDTWTTTADGSEPSVRDGAKVDGDDEPQTKRALCERAAAHAADVTVEHFPELPVEAITWETSTRMQRSAGVAIYERQSEEITIRLSWDAYKVYGWEQFARVVRHELIHAWQYCEYGKAGHGPTFRQWVEPLETDRHCERYAEPKYWIVCEGCESRSPRYRRSKVVKQSERYACGRCGGEISIETV